MKIMVEITPERLDLLRTLQVLTSTHDWTTEKEDITLALLIEDAMPEPNGTLTIS